MLKPVLPNPESDSRLAYSQGILARGETRTLYIAGQVGVDPAGMVAPLFEAQAQQAWRNLLAVLAAAEMEVGDLAKVTVYLTQASDYAAYAALRGEFLGPHKPASTLLVVAALARPEWKFEIEAIAVATA
jgi:enamine deaminase RidA (YjgF/YER057c/UK114 family)